jgi:death-on-curing protein
MAIHADQIRQHGGDRGLRDEGLLESALARVPNRWHYESTSDLLDMAAAYGYGLACNHAFVDGNKRIAFLAMFVFLGLNGYRLVATEHEVVMLMLEVAGGKYTENNLAEWLRRHSQTV